MLQKVKIYKESNLLRQAVIEAKNGNLSRTAHLFVEAKAIAEERGRPLTKTTKNKLISMSLYYIKKIYSKSR